MKGFCARCGEPLKDTDTVCPNCGMPVEPEKEELEDTAEIPAQEEDTQETQVVNSEDVEEEEEKVYVVEKSSWVATFFYILLVIALLLVGAFGYCYFKHPDYIDTAFGFFGVETNFARDIEINGTYGSKPKVTATPSASPSISPSPSATAATN